MKKVKNIMEEKGFVTLNLKDGTKQKVESITKYTYYDDGTNDCNVQLLKPLSIFPKQQEVI